MFSTDDPSTWTLLVTDNEHDARQIVVFTCDAYNIHCQTASSGRECLQQLEQYTPDILLLDIQMPDLSGWDVLQAIRAKANYTGLVIALTAHAMNGDRERILAAGFDGYFPKPLSPRHMIQDLQTLLTQRAKSSANFHSVQ